MNAVAVVIGIIAVVLTDTFSISMKESERQKKAENNERKFKRR